MKLDAKGLALVGVTCLLGCSSSSGSDGGSEGGRFEFETNQVDLITTPTLTDSNGSPPSLSFTGTRVNIENVPDERVLAEVELVGSGSSGLAFSGGSLVLRFHPDVPVGRDLDLQNFGPPPGPTDAAILYAAPDGDSVTSDGALVIDEYTFTATGKNEGHLTMTAFFTNVEVGGNGVVPWTVDGELAISANNAK